MSVPIIGGEPGDGVASAAMAVTSGDSGTDMNRILRGFGSAAIATQDEEMRLCDEVGAIPPPYPPEWYATFWTKNTALHPVVESLVANVEKHGHRIEPIDLRDKKVVEAIEVHMLNEAIHTKHGGTLPGNIDFATLLPTPESVELRKKQLSWWVRLEEPKVKRWLTALCPGITNSLTKVRECVRRDRCVTGNGYIEVVNDGTGTPAEWNWLRSAQMRVRPFLKTSDGDVVAVDVPIRTDFGIEPVRRERRFRTFVQVGMTKRAYFKEFGDPRVLSRSTGKVYASLDSLHKAGHQEATSVIWFTEPHPSAKTIYGLPPWLAADAEVAGLRDSQRVNADLFNNKAIPQMVILVNGARADSQLVKTVQEYMRGVEGIENWHRVLILSAAPAATANNARVSIDIKPLREAIPQDALFLKYQERASESVRLQFRIAKLLLGLGENINRATSEAILQFSEEQVFGPLRVEFDEFMNDFFAYLGFIYWRFISNSAMSRSPMDATTILKDLVTAGGMTINEVRSRTGDVLNEVLPRIDEPYADIPIERGRNLVNLKMLPGEPQVAPQETESDAKNDAIGGDEIDAIMRRAASVIANVKSEPRAFQTHTSKGRTAVIVLPMEHMSALMNGTVPQAPSVG